MSQVMECPTCGGKSKVKKTENNIIYQALQDEEVLQKVSQLKKTMQKYKEKAEALEKEIKELKSNL